MRERGWDEREGRSRLEVSLREILDAMINEREEDEDNESFFFSEANCCLALHFISSFFLFIYYFFIILNFICVKNAKMNYFSNKIQFCITNFFDF